MSMEKDLIQVFEAVKKAADASAAQGLDDSSPQVDRCVDALNHLLRFPVNYQILLSTQVGKRLRNLTKHPRKKIQLLASRLIKTWKLIILEETSKNKENQDSKISNPVKIVSSDAKRTERVQIQTTVQTESHSTEKTVTCAKSGTLIYSKDPTRDKVRELLLEALLKVYKEIDENLKKEAEACDPYRLAVTLECVMFDKWGKSSGPHKFKYRSIMFNLRDERNPDFRRKVLLGDVKAERIVEMLPEEMASDERQMQNGKIKEKALFDCERGGQAKATTDQFKCGKCGKRECTYFQLQTRSADEPMTTFVTCVNCNNHWKFC